jgi:hypothetical protein
VNNAHAAEFLLLSRRWRPAVLNRRERGTRHDLRNGCEPPPTGEVARASTARPRKTDSALVQASRPLGARADRRIDARHRRVHAATSSSLRPTARRNESASK